MPDSGPIYYSVLGVYSGYAVVFSGLFMAFMRFEPIKSRGRLLSLVTALLTVVYFCFFAALQVGLDWEQGIPCDVVVWFSVLFLPLWVTPYLLRGEHVVYQYWTNKGKLEKKEILGFYAAFRKRYPYRRIQAATYAALVLFFVILSLIIELTANAIKRGNLSVSQCLGPQGYVVGAQGIVYIISIIFLLYHLWKAKDAFSIRTELMILLIFCVPVYILFGIVLLLPSSLGELKSNWLLMIILLISVTATIVFPLAVALRIRNWKKQKHIPPTAIRKGSSLAIFNPNDLGTDQFFSLCLGNPTLLDSFKEFTVQSWCVESILFYTEVTDYEIADDDQMYEIAQRILKEYVVAGAPLEVNIDATTRDKIKGLIEKKELTREIFAEAKKVVFSQLRYDVFPKWIRTNSFKTSFEKSGLKRSTTLNQVKKEGEEKKKEKAESIGGEIKAADENLEMSPAVAREHTDSKLRSESAEDVLHERTSDDSFEF